MSLLLLSSSSFDSSPPASLDPNENDEDDRKRPRLCLDDDDDDEKKRQRKNLKYNTRIRHVLNRNLPQTDENTLDMIVQDLVEVLNLTRHESENILLAILQKRNADTIQDSFDLVKTEDKVRIHCQHWILKCFQQSIQDKADKEAKNTTLLCKMANYIVDRYLPQFQPSVMLNKIIEDVRSFYGLNQDETVQRLHLAMQEEIDEYRKKENQQSEKKDRLFYRRNMLLSIFLSCIEYIKKNY